ncbi:MAG: SLBB domain-containing protein, partial [Synergistetes bacterium]|nr:SLBB domain-containing protein [Synergistota bacterium]
MVSKEEVIGLLFEAGVVGAGGAGFPTYYKLKAEGIDTYVINGAECEPLLFGDQYLMRKEAPSLVKTAEKIKEILGAKQVIFALKEKYKQEIKALESEGAQIFPLRDYYPAGDEVILIREVLGRTVPEGGLPLMVGVVVNNVETLYNIGRAMEGLPVTHKFVTINGAVKEPGLWLVPVGVSVEDLINACGGVTVDNPWYIEGGPMTGVYHSKPDFHVTKTTNAIIVVPTDSKLVQYETMSLERILKNARFACIQCNQCTLVCSRKLIGYNLEPHKIMRLMAYPNQLRANVDVLKSALLCSECNL